MCDTETPMRTWAQLRTLDSGPRACLGINLAYLELRITLAKIIFAYDLELVSREIEDWNRSCTSFGLWRKPALLVKFHPHKGA